MTQPTRTLVLTVGTGNLDDIETSLITPLRKSMAAGTWDRIILLPSTVTTETADRLRHDGPEGTIEVRSLPAEGDEYEPDACFAHFDSVVANLIAGGQSPAGITADFTRGTKVMSAALVLAATRHGVPTLRYITGDLRDQRHMVVGGSERIKDGTTAHVTAQRQIDAARTLMETGNFAAVLNLLPDPTTPLGLVIPPRYRQGIEGAIALAAFYSAWDRLDFVTAAARAEAAVGATLPAGWHPLAVDAAAAGWMRQIAADTEQDQTLCRDNPVAMAAHVGRLAAELISNAERRIRQEQFEDANIRVYRAIEIIGQACLFAHGYDSALMPVAAPPVAAFIKEMEKKRSDGITPADKDQTVFAFSREKVARFLKRLGDPIGKRLLDLATKDVSARNFSILIHGFRATGPKDAGPLVQSLAALKQVLVSRFPDHAAAWLAQAAQVPPRPLQTPPP